MKIVQSLDRIIANSDPFAGTRPFLAGMMARTRAVYIAQGDGVEFGGPAVDVWIGRNRVTEGVAKRGFNRQLAS